MAEGPVELEQAVADDNGPPVAVLFQDPVGPAQDVAAGSVLEKNEDEIEPAHTQQGVEIVVVVP